MLRAHKREAPERLWYAASVTQNGAHAADTTGATEKSYEPDAQGKTVQTIPPWQTGMAAAGTSSQFFFVGQYTDEMVPWGTAGKARDRQLREFITAEPIFNSALGIVVSRNTAFSWTLEGPPRKVAKLQRMLQSADFGQGWASMIAKVSVDLYTQDAGAFIEIMRERDAPDADVVGLAHMDSLQCFPTGLPETPVLYLDRMGKYHLMKWYQVVHLREMPATYEFAQFQYCALTRLLRAVRMMRDITIYLNEKIGGRNVRAVVLVKGVTPKDVEDAWEVAKRRHDAAGLFRYSQPVIVGTVNPEAQIGFETLEIASLPDNFDLELSNRQYMTNLAMAFLSDYQDFAPLAHSSLGSGAQSEVLHLKSRGKGPAIFMKIIEQAMNWSVLPEDVEFRFDEMDIEADKAVAEAKQTRANTRKLRLDSGELTPEVARQIAYEEGDLTAEELETLQNQQAILDPTPTITDTSPSEDDLLDDGAQPEAQTGTATADDVVTEGGKDVTPPKARTAVEDDVKTALAGAFDDLYKRLLGKTDATDAEAQRD